MCYDFKDWKDNVGYGCGGYQTCMSSSGPGNVPYETKIDWNPNGVPYYSQWAVDGISALDACCICGGGNVSNFKLSNFKRKGVQ